MRRALVVVVGVLLLLAGPRAQGLEDFPAQVVALLARGDATQARELVEEGGVILGRRERALLRYACDLVGAPQATPELGAQAQRLAADAHPHDAELLRALQTALGSRGAYLDGVLEASYAAVARAPREELVGLSGAPDARTRRVAVSAIASWLAPLRARVSGGGRLDAAERRAVRDAGLIDALIARLPERAAALDRLPAELAAETPRTATALHALVLIEEPALAGLRAAEPLPGAAESIAAIESAIALRQRRFPESTWFDAEPGRRSK